MKAIINVQSGSTYAKLNGQSFEVVEHKNTRVTLAIYSETLGKCVDTDFDESEVVFHKFELTDETLELYGVKLFRIRALRDFGDVKKGDLGGYIAGEENLSHYEDCWVYKGGKVKDGKIFRGNIWGGTIWGGNIWGGEIFGGNIWDGKIFGGNIWGGDIWGGEIRGGKIFGGTIWDGVIRGGEIRGGVIRGGVIETNFDFMVFQAGEYSRITTVTKSDKKINCGCFYGTLKEFKEAVDKKYNGKSDYYFWIKVIEMFFNE